MKLPSGFYLKLFYETCREYIQCVLYHKFISLFSDSYKFLANFPNKLLLIKCINNYSHNCIVDEKKSQLESQELLKQTLRSVFLIFHFICFLRNTNITLCIMTCIFHSYFLSNNVTQVCFASSPKIKRRLCF